MPAVSIELDDELRTNPLLQSDKQLRMFALIVKGDIDSETLTSTMREDWEQVLALAVELKDGKWQNRASAQLGLTAFYDGDADKAASAVAQAIQIANTTGDAGAQIRFLSAMGLGLTKARLYPQALEYFTMALGVAASHPESGYPYLTNEGRAAALIGSERWDLAGNVCDELLGKAKESGRSVHEANALSLRALLLRAKGDQAGALAVIQQAIAIAEAAGMYRSLGEMQALLASSIAAAGDLKTAREVAARAADSTQKSGDAWAVPERLLRVADLMARTGDTAGALDTFERGEAYVDLLTGRALTIQQRSALLSAASELYARHFDFVATTLKRPDLAFAVIEQVRGRLNTDVLLEGTSRHPLAIESERNVSRLRLQLMAARKTSEVVKLRREIFMAVTFHRLIMPNGYSVSLDKFQGLSPVGETGLRDQVNRHYLQTFGVSLAVGAIAGIAQAQSRYGFEVSGADAYRQGVASSLSQSSMRILDRYLNVLPTFTIREGHRIKVYLTNDLLLPVYDDREVSTQRTRTP